jgi:hypothetical protein
VKRREDRAIQKHTLNLYAGDFAKLQVLYASRLGAGKVIRDIIHAHIRKIEEEAAQRVKTPLIEDLGVQLSKEASNEH